MKKKYEKPTIEKLSFAIEDTLMDDDMFGSGDVTDTEPFNFGGNGYQITP